MKRRHTSRPADDGEATTCWPTPLQTLLLHAGLSGGERRSRALDQLEDRARSDRFPPSSERLLPLVYKSARESAGAWPSLLSLAEAAYLRSWQRSESMARYSARVLTVLNDASVPTLVLKGATLALAYGDPALRLSSDVDVLVPGHRFDEARAALLEAGWAPIETPPGDQIPLHARGLVCEGLHLDLHRHALEEFVGTRRDAALWEAAVPFSVVGQRTLSPSACDRLLHACAHGLKWNQEPPVHWVADAVLLLRSEGERFDWDAFACRSLLLDLALPASQGLAYLASEFSVEVPGRIVSQLTATRPSWRRRLAYGAGQRAPHDRSIVERLALRWQARRRRTLAARRPRV